MHQLVKKNYNGFEIEFELIDGQLMANATSMCAAFKKRPTKWLELDSTQRYIAALQAEDAAKGAVSENRTLVETRNGGLNPGTWIREDLILELAGWLNVGFKIQTHKWVAELLRTGSVALDAPKTPAEMLLMFAQQSVEQERRTAALEQRTTGIEQDVAQLKAKTATVPEDYYTVAGWASLQNKSVPISTANALGRKAAALSKAQGYDIGKVSDQRYGRVNSYHVAVLRQVL